MASSMRVSVLSRTRPLRHPSTGTSTAANTNAPSIRDRDREVGSSASSIRSVVRSSTESYASAISTSTVGAMRGGGGGAAAATGMSPARMIVRDTKAKDRPDSKLTPSVLTSPSILEPEVLEEGDRMEEVCAEHSWEITFGYFVTFECQFTLHLEINYCQISSYFVVKTPTCIHYIVSYIQSFNYNRQYVPYG